MPLPGAGSEPCAALDAAADVLDASLAQARPRYFAYIGSSGLEIGVLGDALMASHDVNVAVSAGAADLLEAQTIRWVGQFVGFDDDAVGALAAGGTIANLTALTAAREYALPGFREEGAAGRPMALYCSREAHYSVRRAAEVLGIGGRQVRAIALDADRRMDPDACARAIDADREAGHHAGRRRGHRGNDPDRRGGSARRRSPTCVSSATSGCTSMAPTGCRRPRPSRVGPPLRRVVPGSTRRPSMPTSGCTFPRPAACC